MVEVLVDVVVEVVVVDWTRTASAQGLRLHRDLGFQLMVLGFRV